MKSIFSVVQSWCRRGAGPEESCHPLEKAVAERLANEAKQRTPSLPADFHSRVMRAVARASQADGTGRSPGLPVRPARLAAGSAVAAVAVLVAAGAIHLMSPDRAETIVGEAHSAVPTFDHLYSPEALDGLLHAAMTESLLAEYENLSRDASAASAFVRSATTRWFSMERDE